MEIKKVNVFLDDIRMPKDAWIYPRRDLENGKLIEGRSLENMSGIANDDWIIVRSYEEFVKAIHKCPYNIPDVVSLDHDLLPSHVQHYMTETINSGIIEYEKLEETGYHCALYLIGCIKLSSAPHLPKVYIHSANQHGAANIRKAFDNMLRHPQDNRKIIQH